MITKLKKKGRQNLNIKELVQHKKESLQQYKAKPEAKQTVINAMTNEINCIVDHFNTAENYIMKLENEINDVSKKYIKEKNEAESMRARLMFYHESGIIDGYEQSLNHFDLSDITNRILTKPYEHN